MAKSIDIMLLQRGPITDNGATPWYTVLKIGSQKQRLKFAIDTGTTHSWVTSIGCTTGACLNHQRYDFRSSSTFLNVTNPYDLSNISFGPWGTLQVSMGSDTILFDSPASGKEERIEKYKFYVGWHYTGQQFTDLIWDGAIGVPTVRPDDVDSSELISILLEHISSEGRALRFNYGQSSIQLLDTTMGQEGYDGQLLKKNVVESKVLPGAWVIDLDAVRVVGDEIVTDITFCLDTGSSRFKGDPVIIETIIRAITRDGLLPSYIASVSPDFSVYPTINLIISGVSIEVTPQQYFEKLSEDYYKLAFHGMAGLDGMLLAGSTFLEHHSPEFYFDEHRNGMGVGLYISERIPPNSPA